MVAARHLNNWGANVHVKLVGDPARLKQTPAQRWRILERRELGTKTGPDLSRATATLTLAVPKTGLLAPQARPYVGDLYLADIGVPAELYQRLGIEVDRWFERDSIVPIG